MTNNFKKPPVFEPMEISYLMMILPVFHTNHEKTGVRAKRGLICIIRKNGLQLRWVTAMELIGCGALFKEKVAEFQDMVKKDLLVAV